MKQILSIRHFCGKSYRFAKRIIKHAIEVIDIKLHKNAFVFGAPYHSNAGDQAQSFCIEKWIKQNYPKYKVRIFNTDTVTWDNYGMIHFIRKYINKSDKVFLHSGYHTTDLYLFEEKMQRKVVELFHDRQVVFFPQTILFQTEEEERKSSEIYNAHPNLLLMCRDTVSYTTAEKVFNHCNRVLFPDIVTTMIGEKNYQSERNHILLCVRNDKEALLCKEEREALIEQLSKIDEVEVTDTTLPIDGPYFCKHREEILKDVWQKYSSYRVVVTDRYHGTIFSLIAGTPVVVMPSTDHKLKSGVRWFPESFEGYVRYVPHVSAIVKAVRDVYERKYSYTLPDYFCKEYYSKLKEIIEENV